MRHTKVKICGLYRDEDISFVNQTLPDYVGFVLNVPKSHRNVTTQWVLAQKQSLDPRIATVGVFVNPTLNQVREVAQALDVVQLHGDETPADLLALRRALSPHYPHLQYWKASSVRTASEVDQALSYPADMVLLDYGKGEGRSFDWSILSHVTAPYILAGGITPLNVKQAITALSPTIVDLSSGVETDRKKDLHKIKQLLKEMEL